MLNKSSRFVLTGHRRLTGSAASTGVTLIILRVVDLAGIHKRAMPYSA